MAISKEVQNELNVLRAEIEGLRNENMIMSAGIVNLQAMCADMSRLVAAAEGKRQEIDARNSGKNTTPDAHYKDVLFSLKAYFDSKPESKGYVFFVDKSGKKPVLMVSRQGQPRQPVREQTIANAMIELGLSF
ncbi:hypothetical protein [Chromatium okenii]|uniref:hypothetical protein n=1 Tax=Chromatium okenii TaxID=61644 RepID=UPI0026EA80D0|nr:hypothetical protein [Chromatium okenii]MBV5308507.1 hypothetical protein [Chromatium okenii]